MYSVLFIFDYKGVGAIFNIMKLVAHLLWPKGQSYTVYIMLYSSYFQRLKPTPFDLCLSVRP
jgi:hypothetical protein